MPNLPGFSPWKRLATIAALLCWGALFLASSTLAEKVRTRNLGATPAECEKQCKEPPLKDLQHFDGDDLTKPEKMLDRLKSQRAIWVEEELKKDYGKYFDDMFQPKEGGKRVSVGRNRFLTDASMLRKTKSSAEELPESADEGWKNLIRKMKIKITQVQLSILVERENAKAICLDECGKEDTEGSRFLKAPQSTGLYSKVTWVTGGHSASAGHGNMYRESYTANMDRALTPLFKSIGLDFEGRNYAMGGTDCGDEVALCMNQIFGKDFDIISWDYGMTDGHALWKMLLYAYKAAGISKATNSFSQPGKVAYRPALIALHQGNDKNLCIDEMQKLGMTTLGFDNDYMHNVIEAALPDMFGMTDQQIENLPPWVRYLKCGGGIEVGDPGCKDNKFNNTICDVRKARVSWHPGFKAHRLFGLLMATTLLDVMEDTLQSLIDESAEEGNAAADESIEDAKKRLMKRLRDLDGEEKKAYNNIFESPIPEAFEPHMKAWWKDSDRAEHLEDVDMEAFFKEPSLCHTAILPSQARFHGFVTENFSAVGEVLDQNYEEGVSNNEVYGVENPRGSTEGVPYGNDKEIFLVKEDSGRQVCEEHLNLDYKDYFHVSNMGDWRSITLPNDSEMKEYSEFDGKTSKGYVLICLAGCDWGKCKKGDLHNALGWIPPKPGRGQAPPSAEELAKVPKVEITVNGERVTEASDMHRCYTLKNKNGHTFKANADGRYEVKMRISKSAEYGYGYLKMSSFILV